MARARETHASDMDEEENGGVSGVRALDRALAILQAFSAEQPAMSVLEL